MLSAALREAHPSHQTVKNCIDASFEAKFVCVQLAIPENPNPAD